MRRSNLTWVTAALAAVLSFPAPKAVLADEAAAPTAETSPPADAAAPEPQLATGGEKVLHTVPLDGGGDDLFPASSRLVRDLVKVRPKEDLIICIAGCNLGADRVVYSQPIDPLRKPAVAAVSNAQGQPMPPPSEMANPEAATTLTPKPTSALEKPSAAKASKDAKAHMEPTSSEAPSKAAPETKKPETPSAGDKAEKTAPPATPEAVNETAPQPK